VEATGQPCFLKRPLRPEITRVTDHPAMNASEDKECDHLTMLVLAEGKWTLQWHDRILTGMSNALAPSTTPLIWFSNMLLFALTGEIFGYCRTGIMAK
jgi:hypothetical protein